MTKAEEKIEEKLRCCRCGREISLSEEATKFAKEMEWDKDIICKECYPDGWQQVKQFINNPERE